jgi:ubiquitin-protein ligase E3 B
VCFQELQRLINGDDAPIDVSDLRRHTRYAGGYNELTPTIRDLWRVLSEMDHTDKALFLKFVTACSRPPLLGFRHLQPPFTVQCVSGDGGDTPSVLAFFGMGRNETHRLPTASTCFNLLKLPNFKSRAVLRERLLYAIRAGQGFELS